MQSHRNLTPSEIDLMELNGCSCTDWKQVTVMATLKHIEDKKALGDELIERIKYI